MGVEVGRCGVSLAVVSDFGFQAMVVLVCGGSGTWFGFGGYASILVVVLGQ